MATNRAKPQSPSEAVLEMYAAFNRADPATVAEIIAEDVVYEDLHIFEAPMRGRAEAMNFFNKFWENCGTKLHFIVDGITTNDPTCCGVMWHMEHKGSHFPYSKGCSFYKFENTNGKLKLVYGRDVMEPAKKHGLGGLGAIKGVLDQHES
ncbi:hypothetical protein KP509_03G080200 [Ceratopteris richardii]|uniref:SnoaL-like domain-containing protein n=1 Tax=Ceratopteris richardii TaxID=49495 RepID=A0A8T2V1C0_CERRI|nr:hypothetical protein KP509_03G080200 [Ceratopteris richardii]